MPDLHLSDDLALPIEAVTQTFAVLAKRGMGKTYAASVLAEELLKQRQRLVIVDPVGVWWGLRSSADGQRPGYPVVILGGDHADLPLDKDAGSVVADMVVDNDLAVVLDLSLLRKGEQRHFMTAFLETLYHRNRRALHVIVDEADLYAPQRPVKGAERLLGAMEDMVRRGRARGLGTTLISQRPAVIHKDVLTQTEVLVAMRVTGPQDRNAIDDWIKQHGEAEERRQLLDSLASLPVGTAWVWSPGWLDVFAKVQIRQRRTFDSSATPKAGAAVERPSEYATVDLDALRDRLAEFVEKAERDDPKVLRGRIRDLEAEAVKLRSERPEPETVTVEVPVVPDGLRERVEQWGSDFGDWLTNADTLRTLISRMDEIVSALAEVTELPPRPESGNGARPVTAVPDAPTDAEPGVHLRKGARLMLAAFAAPPGHPRTKVQIGALAGYAPTGGTFGTYWGELSRAGLITEAGDGTWVITDAGLEAVDPGAVRDTPRTTGDVLDVWEPNLRKGVRVMLRTLVDAYPDALSRDELGARAGYGPSGGTFGTYLGELRRLGLADVDGDQVRAGGVLFPEAAR